jgi:hypothetical protein
MVNPATRIIEIADMLSACLITGTEKIRCGYGNGDCILLDFQHGVFAVADATERFSSASRNFLKRFHGKYSGGNRPSSPGEWLQCINEVYGAQEYAHKTTFSCFVIQYIDGDELTANILSGGDSTVCVADREGNIVYQTKPNMNFAGRSTHYGEVYPMRLNRNHARVVLFTDGLGDYYKSISHNAEKNRLPEEIYGIPVHGAAAVIQKKMAEYCTGFEHDDIGFVILDPFAVDNSLEGSVILGGTTPIEEKRYLAHGMHENDRSMPINAWGVDVLLHSGIVLQR